MQKANALGRFVSKSDTRLFAIVLMCCATFSFALLDSSAKYLSAIASIPVFQVIWIRFMSHIVLNTAFLGLEPVRAALTSKHRRLQILRSVFLLGATMFNFLSLQYLQLDQAATIFFLSPFIVAAVAGPVLGEWVGWRRLLAICVGFSGVILVLRPGYGGIHWAASLSFLSTLSYALYSVSTRYLARYDSAQVTQVFSPIAGAVLIAPLALSTWQTPHSVGAGILLFMLGFFGGFGHWLVILAHRQAPAPVLAPFGYINIVFTIVIGYAVFGDKPDWWTLAGAAIIISSGIYLLLRERQRSASAPASSATVPDG